MDAGGYSHNSKGIGENFAYPISINNKRTTTTHDADTNFVDTLSFIIFLLHVKSVE